MDLVRGPDRICIVRAAKVELPRGIRINAVSPGWVREMLIALGMDPSGEIPADQVARGYVESVESRRNGDIIETSTFAER